MIFNSISSNLFDISKKIKKINGKVLGVYSFQERMKSLTMQKHILKNLDSIENDLNQFQI